MEQQQGEAARRSNGTRTRSPAESDPSTSRVAMPAAGKLAVEAGEQRRIFVEREPRAGIDLQCVVPRARAVNREQRTGYRHKRAGDRAVGIEFMHPRRSQEW